MRLKRTILSIISIGLTTVCFSQIHTNDSINKYFPTSTTGQIINHQYYSLSYSTVNKLAEWVIYKLTCNQTKGEINRTNSFRPDPLLKERSAQLVDYKGSGYDRGHLAPAGDMKVSYEVMSESFYLTNMTPQHPSLNRGIWLGLEDRVRVWACEDSVLYIVAGPIITASDSTIGPNKIKVPSLFYKIVYYNKSNDYEMIGFIFPNCPGSMSLENYIYKVDDIESITGIDFFPIIPDSIETRIEKNVNLKFWHFNNEEIK